MVFHQTALADTVREQSVTKDNYTIKATPFYGQNRQRQTDELDPSTNTFFGGIFSLSRKVHPNLEAGINVSYRSDDTVADIIPPGFINPGRLGSDSYEGGIFAELTYKGISVKPSFRAGIDDYELERPDLLTGLVGFSQSRGWHVGGGLEVSALLPVKTGLFLKPVASIDSSLFTANAFTEAGAGPNNIAFEQVNDTRVTGLVGLGFGAAIPVKNLGLLAPFINLKYKRNFITGPIETGAALASGLLDLGDVTLLPAQDANGFTLDTGVILRDGDGFELTAVYLAEFFPTSTLQSFAAQLKIPF